MTKVAYLYYVFYIAELICDVMGERVKSIKIAYQDKKDNHDGRGLTRQG